MPLGRISLFSALTPSTLLDALRQGREGTHGGPARAAILDPVPERIAQARTIVERGRPWRGRDGIWFSPVGLLSQGGTLAFVFPGIEAVFEPRVDDVARHFGVPAPARAAAGGVLETGIAVIGISRMLDRILRDLGAVPADVAGHSIGEWSGMVTTGIIPDEAIDSLIATLRPGMLKVPDAVFAAAGCGVERAVAALEGLGDIAVSHDNCPHQVLVCGVESSIDTALERLRRDAILCQKLPFRSGFHSPLFAGYLEQIRQSFAGFTIGPPRVTLWSATTCAPYPHAPEAIRALALEHLVRPVRFRELVETLHAKGTRVFVQVGAGGLVHFIEDTLRSRPHLAMAANVKERTGMDQLRRLAGALFVEGADVDVSRVASSSRPAVLAEFDETMAAIAQAQRDVLARLTARQAPAPRETTTPCSLSVETIPETLDHCFVAQPSGWPVLSDRQPVVPIATSLELMIEHAKAFLPGRAAVAVEEVRAFRWLMVAPPVHLRIACRLQAPDRVRVCIGDYSEGVVVFSDRYPPAPPSDDAPVAGASRPPITARALYDERWLFHGPAFQGIVDVTSLGKGGIRGTLEATPARGALLDNAGQLLGYWVLTQLKTDNLTMPVRLGRVRLFGPHPRLGERLVCTVRVRSLDDRSVFADLTLARDGRVWVAVEDWEHRRFEIDERLWPVVRWPETSILSDPRPEGYVTFEDRYRTAACRDRLAWRYLGERERSEYERQEPRRQRAWLNGRIAAKDAARSLLWRLGHGPLFPVEIAISNDPTGRPIARTETGRDVRISIAHKDNVAVAMAREANPVGIDIERVEHRSDSFAELSFGREELRLVEGEPPDEGWTRLWAAKEAAAKALGTGLAGAPKLPVRERAGGRLLVGDIWVNTKRQGEFIIGWTDA